MWCNGMKSNSNMKSTPPRGTRELVEAEFDAAFYRDRYGRLGAKMDPVAHFLSIGWVQGRDPSPTFSVLTYLLRNSDVLLRHLNPFVHYLLFGRSEGRKRFKTVLDDKFYLPEDVDVATQIRTWFEGWGVLRRADAAQRVAA